MIFCRADKNASASQQTIHPIAGATLEVGDSQNQHPIRFLGVNHGIRESVAEVPPHFPTKMPMQVRVGTYFHAKPFNLGSKTRSQGKAFPVRNIRSPPAGQSARKDAGYKASPNVAAAEFRHHLLAWDALHFAAANFLQPALGLDRPSFVDSWIRPARRQTALIPFGKLLLLTR
jgi:hypothetical protein